MQTPHRDFPSRQLVTAILRGIGVTSKAAFNIGHFEENLNWLQDVILHCLRTSSINAAGMIFKATAERWNVDETPFELREQHWQMLAKEYSLAQPKSKEKKA